MGWVFSLLFLVGIAFVSRLVVFPRQLLPLTCLSGKPSCTSAPDTAFFPESVSLTCYHLVALWGEGSKQGLVGVPAPLWTFTQLFGVFSLAVCWSRLPSARVLQRRRIKGLSSRPLLFPQCPTLFGSGSSWRAAVHGITELDVTYRLNNDITLSPFQGPWSVWEFILVFHFLKICRLPFFLCCPWNSTRQPTACVYALSCQDFSFCFKLILFSKSFTCVQLFVTPWTIAHQAPLSMAFSRQEYWHGLPFSSPDISVRTVIYVYYSNFVCYCVSCSVLSHSFRPHGPHSPPGSSVHGILQVRTLEWVAIPFSSWSRDQIRVSCIVGRFLTIWATYFSSFRKYKILRGEKNVLILRLRENLQPAFLPFLI